MARSRRSSSIRAWIMAKSSAARGRVTFPPSGVGQAWLVNRQYAGQFRQVLRQAGRQSQMLSPGLCRAPRQRHAIVTRIGRDGPDEADRVEGRLRALAPSARWSAILGEMPSICALAEFRTNSRIVADRSVYSKAEATAAARRPARYLTPSASVCSSCRVPAETTQESPGP